MAMDKATRMILERLERIEAKLDQPQQPAPKLPTKKELMAIEGVGPATADKILALLKPDVNWNS